MITYLYLCMCTCQCGKCLKCVFNEAMYRSLSVQVWDVLILVCGWVRVGDIKIDYMLAWCVCVPVWILQVSKRLSVYG